MNSRFPADIFTEPEDVDFDTLRNLGPLAPLAGVWEGDRGLDVHLGGEGEKKDAFHERDLLFHHTDRNRLRKVAEPTPNRLMRGTS